MGFALRDEAVLRRVQAFELGVLLRDDARHRLKGERIGHVGNRELFRRDLVAHRTAVQRYGNELELVAVQDQRTGGIAADFELRGNKRVVFTDIDVEVDGLDPESGWGVILEVDRPGLGFFHPPILRRAASPRAASFYRNIRYLARGRRAPGGFALAPRARQRPAAALSRQAFLAEDVAEEPADRRRGNEEADHDDAGRAAERCLRRRSIPARTRERCRRRCTGRRSSPNMYQRRPPTSAAAMMMPPMDVLG